MLRSALVMVVTGVVTVVVMGFGSSAWGAAPWCSGFNKADSNAHGDLKDLQERDDPRWAIPALVDATCAPDADLAKQQPQVAAARDRWSKLLDMSDADWADAVGYAMLDRYADGLRFKNTKKAWSTFDAVDQYLSLTDNYGSSDDISHDKNYLADAFGSKLSELGRAGYLLYCIGGSEEKVVQWAMCAGDAAKLDWKQVAVDLRSSKAYDGADKMRIRLALMPLRQKLAEHPAAVKKLVAKDPGIAKVFELAEKTYKEWAAGRAAEPVYLEAAAAMDDARVMNSRTGFQGCQQKTWPVWRKAMATIAAKEYEGVRDDRENGKSILDGAIAPIINHPNTYLASVAFTTCMGIGRDKDKNEQPNVLVRYLGSAMMRWPGFRGPRSAAQTAVMSAGIQLDDRDAKLEYPDVDRSFGASGGSTSGGGVGVVASVKPGAKTATVTFRKETIKETRCTQSKMTNRISQIMSNGTIVYYHNCLKYGVVTVDKTSNDQTVDIQYLEGVKPGVQATNVENVVVATWAKPGAAIPTTVFGVTLK